MVFGEVWLLQEEEHVQHQERDVLENGDDDAHGVEADQTLDADVMTQVLFFVFHIFVVVVRGGGCWVFVQEPARHTGKSEINVSLGVFS